jgi:DDB1- and CUL4-associated factor 11
MDDFFLENPYVGPFDAPWNEINENQAYTTSLPPRTTMKTNSLSYISQLKSRNDHMNQVKLSSLVASHYVPSKFVRPIIETRNQRFYNVCFTRDGSKLVASGQDSNIYLFDVENDFELVTSIEARNISWTITSINLHPNSKTLVYSTLNNMLHLVDIDKEGSNHRDIFIRDSDRNSRHGFGVYQAIFTSTGSEVVMGSTTNKLIVYDVPNQSVSLSLQAHNDDINAVCITNNDNLIISGSDDFMIHVFDRREPHLLLTGGRGVVKPTGYLPGHLGGITSLHANDHLITSNSKDQTVKMWDLRKSLVSSVDDSASDRQFFNSIFQFDYRFEPFRKYLLPIRPSYDSSVLTLRGHSVSQTLIKAYFSPPLNSDKKYIYSGSSDGLIYIWDVNTGTLDHTVDANHHQVIRDVAWHPTLPMLASASWDGKVNLCQYDQDTVRDDFLVKERRLRTMRLLTKAVRLYRASLAFICDLKQSEGEMNFFEYQRNGTYLNSRLAKHYLAYFASEGDASMKTVVNNIKRGLPIMPVSTSKKLHTKLVNRLKNAFKLINKFTDNHGCMSDVKEKKLEKMLQFKNLFGGEILSKEEEYSLSDDQKHSQVVLLSDMFLGEGVISHTRNRNRYRRQPDADDDYHSEDLSEEDDEYDAGEDRNEVIDMNDDYDDGEEDYDDGMDVIESDSSFLQLLLGNNALLQPLMRSQQMRSMIEALGGENYDDEEEDEDDDVEDEDDEEEEPPATRRRRSSRGRY